MEGDSGRAALWLAGTILTHLQLKRIMSADELDAIAHGFETGAPHANPQERADMALAAKLLRQFTVAPEDLPSTH